MDVIWYEGGTETRGRDRGADATTSRAKAYLFAMARHSEALAEGRLAVAPVTLDDEQARTARRSPSR